MADDGRDVGRNLKSPVGLALYRGGDLNCRWLQAEFPLSRIARARVNFWPCALLGVVFVLREQYCTRSG
jgi:hypothetical protein